jgi:hypothetical protein
VRLVASLPAGRPFIGVLLIAALLATGCTGPLRRPGTAPPEPAVTTAPDTAPAVRTVAAPWQEGMKEYGINVYWENSPADDDEVVRAKAARILDYVVGLDANAVALSFPIYTTGITSTVLRTGRATPSPRRVEIAVEEAVRRDLRVSVRPILNEKVLVRDNPKAWRGTIAPGSRTAWFDNYRELLMPYVRAAAGATTVVVATELNSLEGDRRWAEVISSIRRDFDGEVAYSANYDSFQRGPVRVPADTVGVDAYIPMELGDDAGVERIAAGWSRWLERHGDDGPPVLHEVGIAAQDGAYRRPGHWGDGSRPLNLKVQQRWYDGICRAMHDGGAAGVYWWKVDFDADPATAGRDSPDRLTFIGRPVEESIRRCFAPPA